MTRIVTIRPHAYAYQQVAMTGIWMFHSPRVKYVFIGMIVPFLVIPIIFLFIFGDIYFRMPWLLLIFFFPVFIMLPVYYLVMRTTYQDKMGFYTKIIPGNPEAILTMLRSLIGQSHGIFGGIQTRKGAYTYFDWFILPDGLNLWVRIPRLPMTGISFFGAEIGVGKVTDYNRQAVQNIMTSIDATLVS